PLVTSIRCSEVPPFANVLPSGEKQSDQGKVAANGHWCNSLAVATSHNRKLPPYPPAASILPSGEKAAPANPRGPDHPLASFFSGTANCCNSLPVETASKRIRDSGFSSAAFAAEGTFFAAALEL